MLNVTVAAREFLAEKLAELEAPDGVVMRVFANGPSLSLKLGPIEADDRTICHGDKPVLAVAPSVSEAADHRTLDMVATIRGRRLKVTERSIREPDLQNRDST